MKRSILIACVFLIYSCSQQSIIVQEPIDLEDIDIPTARSARWFTCQENTDCAVVDDMNCTFASVNRRYIAEFQLWAKYEMSQKYADRCEGNSRREINYLPVCDAGSCSSKLK